MTNTSTTYREELHAPSTGEAILRLITISHDSLSEPLRFTSDGVDTTSRGYTFQSFPFQIDLPNKTKDQPPKMMLSIDNVDRQIVQTIRELQSHPTVTLEIVLSSDPDTVESSFPDFQLVDVQYDRLVVQGDLIVETLQSEPVPAGSYDPAGFPAMF